MGCACGGHEDMERWVCLNQEMLLTQCCVIIQDDGDLGLKQAIGKQAGPYHVPFPT